MGNDLDGQDDARWGNRLVLSGFSSTDGISTISSYRSIALHCCIWALLIVGVALVPFAEQVVTQVLAERFSLVRFLHQCHHELAPAMVGVQQRQSVGPVKIERLAVTQDVDGLPIAQPCFTDKPLAGS